LKGNPGAERLAVKPEFADIEEDYADTSTYRTNFQAYPGGVHGFSVTGIPGIDWACIPLVS
jgi:hypothetical protein